MVKAYVRGLLKARFGYDGPVLRAKHRPVRPDCKTLPPGHSECWCK